MWHSNMRPSLRGRHGYIGYICLYIGTPKKPVLPQGLNIETLDPTGTSSWVVIKWG